MKVSRLIYLSLVLALVSFIFGCSGQPTEQIQMTEKVMEQAKAEHAEEFAPEAWKGGEEGWRMAQSQLEKQKWGDATSSLLKAKAHFEKARDLAKGKRAVAIKEIEGMRITAEKRCKTLKDALDAGGKKLSAAKHKEFEEACKTAEEKIAKVGVQLQNGQYNDAKYQAGTTLREIYDTQKELESVLGKKSS